VDHVNLHRSRSKLKSRQGQVGLFLVVDAEFGILLVEQTIYSYSLRQTEQRVYLFGK
jgi:hypothetical protein